MVGNAVVLCPALQADQILTIPTLGGRSCAPFVGTSSQAWFSSLRLEATTQTCYHRSVISTR